MLEIQRTSNAQSAINGIGASGSTVTPAASGNTKTATTVPSVAQYQAFCATAGFPIPGSPQALSSGSTEGKSAGGGAGVSNSGSSSVGSKVPSTNPGGSSNAPTSGSHAKTSDAQVFSITVLGWGRLIAYCSVITLMYTGAQL
ncbi:hypothetical protein CVT25_014729 [Psilocybe cyanescens]|uniref:Uncharacterized protein n=1 Tax=Psilocybe cyanescens TaxID=93625 RepID=A0A409XRB1_PSICY|nr:hypothetical protein CVT25_014729 [Psilocybe cyanescens]